MRDVLGDEEPRPKLLPSLERMYTAVWDVEAFMAEHVARNFLTRGLSYAFTDRLSRSLEDAFQEIVTVTLLCIEQGAQYDGEFRLIRHCEVDKLEMIREDKSEEGGTNVVVRYHRARVDGELVVVRCCEGSGVQDASEMMLYERIASCDLILKEMSIVRKSHPNVARIYGWSKGSIQNRFTVFKSGFRDMDSVLRESPNPIATLVRWDAVHHLKTMSISWAPCGPSFALDDRLEPTIGLQNDLRRIDPNTEPLNNIELQVYWILDTARDGLQMKDMARADAQASMAGYHNGRLSKLLGRFDTRPRTSSRLRQLMEAGAAETAWEVDSWIWANILLALDKSRGNRLETGTKVFHNAGTAESDSVEVFAVDEGPENIVYNRYRLNVGHDGREEAREILGILSHTEDPSHQPYLIPTGESGTVSAPE